MPQLPTTGQTNWGATLNDWLKQIGDETTGGVNISATDLDPANYTLGYTYFQNTAKELRRHDGTVFQTLLKLGGTTSSDIAPTNPDPGDTYFDTTDNKFYYYDGSSWVELGGGGGSVSVQSLTCTGATQTIDWSSGGIVELDVTGATSSVALTLQNPENGDYVIEVTQGTTASDIIFPTGTEQGGGITGETVYGFANTKQIITVLYKNGGYLINTDVYA